MKRIALLFGFIFAIAKVQGQISTTDAWYSYGGSMQLEESTSIKYLVQCRSTDLKPTPRMFFALAGVDYKLPGTNWSIGGYYYLIEKKDFIPDLGATYLPIHFTRQEIGYQHLWSGIKLIHKLRLEQVWGPETNFFQQNRLFNGIKFPLKKGNDLHVYTYSELFYRWNDQSFNRNRIFAGIQFRLHSRVSLQVGYLSEIYKYNKSKNLFVGINQKL